MSRRAQRGLSLIELMIAMVLGLIIVAAVYNAYRGSTRSATFTRGLQSMQENGRHGVAALQRGLRLAGYSPDVRFPPIDLAGSGDARVVVRLRQAADCNGVSTAARGGIAVNAYAHDPRTRTITCEGDSDTPTAMPLVEDVEAFRVLYGLDEAGGDDGFGDDVPERYVPHAEVEDAGQVAAIRFALLVSSDKPIRTRPRSERHVLLDRIVETDGRLARTVFAGTVELRNRRGGE